MGDLGFLKDMSALGLAALAVTALALTVRAVLNSKANGYFKPEAKYPTTVKDLEMFVDTCVFHRRNGDLMHWRMILERLGEGRHIEAMEAFERLVDVAPRSYRGGE